MQEIQTLLRVLWHILPQDISDIIAVFAYDFNILLKSAVENNDFNNTRWILRYGVRLSLWRTSEHKIQTVKPVLSIDSCVLEAAISNNSIEIVALLIEHGAQITQNSMLMAIHHSNLEILKLLHLHSLKTNFEIGSLTMASIQNNTQVLKYLYLNGARDGEREYPALKFSIMKEQLDMIKIHCRYISFRKIYMALEYAIWRKKKQSEICLRSILRHLEK